MTRSIDIDEFEVRVKSVPCFTAARAAATSAYWCARRANPVGASSTGVSSRRRGETVAAALAVEERRGEAERLAEFSLVRAGRVFDLGNELAHDMPKGPYETFGGFRTTPYHVPQALYRRDDPPAFDYSVEV